MADSSSSSLGGFLREIEADARKILRNSNDKRLKEARAKNSHSVKPATDDRDDRQTSKDDHHTSNLSSDEIVELSKKALSLSSPRKPLVPSTKDQPSGVTKAKVMRTVTSNDDRGSARTPQQSPFLASPMKISSAKKKAKGKKTPQQSALTRKQWSSSLSASNAGNGRQQAKLDPVDLSTEDLRKKYRCEATRAAAYDAYLKQKELRAFANGGVEVADDDEVPVEKHPIHEKVDRLIAQVNEKARDRSRRRLESNAWQLDVHKQCMAELKSIRTEKLARKTRDALEAEGEEGCSDSTDFDASAAAVETAVSTEASTEVVLSSNGTGDSDDKTKTDMPGPSSLVVRNPSPNLSMRLAGNDLHQLSTLVPGCTAIGPVGGLWSDLAEGDSDTASEYNDLTQAVACFARDPFTSAVKVTFAQAIETPIYSKPVVAWDPTQILPDPAPHEAPSEVVPALCAPNDVIYQEPLVSPLADARPSTILILDPAATEQDWTTPSQIDGDDTQGLRIQHRRHMNDTTEYGFPTKCYANLIESDTSVSTHAFGVTEQGLTLNKPCVSDKMIEWKSEECVTEPLSKEKSPKDYHYIAKSPDSGKDGGSPNEGTIFTILLNRYEIGSILRTTERKQQEEQRRLQLRKTDNKKKAELAAKIRAATELMEKKLAAQRERILNDEAPSAAGESDGADGSKEGSIGAKEERDDVTEEAWQRRMRCSVIATVRDVGNTKWEERQLLDSKKRFYRNTDPCLILSDAASWDPPLEWERVALPVPGIVDADDETQVASSSVQESESYVKEDHENITEEATTDDDDDEISRLASLLAKNDSFVKAMAERLGVPEDKIRSTITDDGDDTTEESTAVEQIGTDESADPSVTEHLPQGYADVYAIKCAERLQLADAEKENADPREKGGVRGYAWRNLPRAIIGEDFFHLNKRKTQTCPRTCKPNKCRIVGLVDPVKGIKHVIDDNIFQTSLQTEFIADIKADRFKIANDRKKQEEREGSLLDASQQKALDQILAVSLNEKDDASNQYVSSDVGSSTKAKVAAPIAVDLHGKSNAELIAAAIDAVKCASYSDGNPDGSELGPLDVLEHVLDELGLSVNSRDEHGNTLLILAAQRANKRTVKFLLRRNANINAKNFAGSTSLHYLYEYGHEQLAEYLISKGARDDILNEEGLTCYEGLSRETLEAL